MKQIVFIFLCLPIIASAQLKLAKPFSSNMVLQREQPIHFWGKGLPGENVLVEFGGATKSIVVKQDSSWGLYFNKLKASGLPLNLIVKSAGQSIVLSNILIGDIWLCIGQSNMQFSLKEEIHYRDEIKRTELAGLRFYNPSFIGKGVFNKAFTDSMIQRLTINEFYENVSWQESDSLSARDMTAVGYYFGKQLLQETGVPIGLVHLAIGGCPIETFISKDAFMNSKQFSSKVNGNWLTNTQLPVWIKERGVQNVGGIDKVRSDELGPNHGYKPGFAFEAGIQPLVPLPIKGVLWYQGESNAQEIDRVMEYTALQKLMIEDYRKLWRKDNLPFYWVQLSSIDSVNYKSQLWPLFRDEQRKLLSLVKNGGMAVCSDIGAKSNVHPTNKKFVGERLARWALLQEYKKELLPSGPLPLSAIYENNKIVIHFKYAGTQLSTSDSLALRGFSINGVDEVNAVINKNRVIIQVQQKPEFIYYGWKPYTIANLVNGESLPASTFKIKVQ